jgi:uncharacterized cofD-like protein
MKSILERIRLFAKHWPHILRPGLKLKRWLLLFLVGFTVADLGLAPLTQGLYSALQPLPLFYLLSFQWLPSWLRGSVLFAFGFALAGYGAWRFQQTLFEALVPGQNVLKTLLQRQQRRQGPKIVTIGGGTGMSQLLRGLRAHTDNITAIVTVADDGGSSGRLRQQMRVLPPGDFRNNIAALSEAEDLMTRLFQYRFPEFNLQDDLEQNDDPPANGYQRSGLAGHSFGNLFIATMAAITGSFESGLAQSSRVLAVRGRVIPSTLEEITLCAEIRRSGLNAQGDMQTEWLLVEGESNLPKAGGVIEHVFLKPEAPRAYPEAIRAILQADLILVGPGSFFTSVIPNLLTPAVRDALCATSAIRIYLCNLVTQPGETDAYNVSDHVRQLQLYSGNAFVNVLANSNYNANHPPAGNGQWVALPAESEALSYRLFTGDLVDAQRPWRHDPAKLAARILEVYTELNRE